MSLFARKPIAELLVDEGNPNALKRALGAGDLIMLAIGAERNRAVAVRQPVGKRDAEPAEE
jgi:hypothetical protein